MQTTVSISFSLFLLIMIILAVLIGIFVYRDSNKRGMNPVLWTLIAVIAPCFIGLIIYLIVRTQYYDTKCPKCTKQINERFMVCPHCGEILKERCRKCNYPLELDWINCPNCGETVPEEQRKVLSKPSKDKGLKWILMFIIAVPLIFCIVFITSIITYSVNPIINASGCISLTKEELKEYDKDGLIAKILDDCDRQGKGTYIIQSDYIARPYIDDGGSECYIDALIYRNDGFYVVGAEMFKSSPFAGTTINYTFSENEGEKVALGYTLCYYQLAAEKKANIKTCNVIKNSANDVTYDFIDYKLITSNTVGADVFTDSTTFDACVYFNKNVEDVYSLEYDILIDDEIEYTDEMTNEDGSNMSDLSVNFSYNYANDENCKFRLRLFDNNGKIIKESDLYSIEDGNDFFEFEVWYNKDRKLIIDDVTMVEVDKL